MADALSRKDGGEIELQTLVSIPEVDWSKLDDEIQQDVFLQQIRQDMISGTKVQPGFALPEGKLFYKDMYVIPRKSSFIPKLLHLYHASQIGGHTGDIKTYLRLAAEWCWVGMRKMFRLM